MYFYAIFIPYSGLFPAVKTFVVVSQFVDIIFRGCCLLQVKVVKVASFVGKIFMLGLIHSEHINHKYFAPRKLPVYGTYVYLGTYMYLGTLPTYFMD